MDFSRAVSSTFNPSPPTSFQSKECVLYGSIKLGTNYEQFLQRLRGLCDPGVLSFHEHEMVFSLKTGDNPDLTLRIRRKFNRDNHLWHWRYVAAPEPDFQCLTIVRKVIDSVGASANTMEFVKHLGLRMDYEYITQGEMFIKGKIKIILSRISYTEKPGDYDKRFIKPVTSDSYLVEASISVPVKEEYTTAAKNLRDFCDQLLPLCNLRKVNYWQAT